MWNLKWQNYMFYFIYLDFLYKNNPLNLHVLLYKCDFPEENADHVLYFIINIFLIRFWKIYISIYTKLKKKTWKCCLYTTSTYLWYLNILHSTSDTVLTVGGHYFTCQFTRRVINIVGEVSFKFLFSGGHVVERPMKWTSRHRLRGDYSIIGDFSFQQGTRPSVYVKTVCSCWLNHTSKAC